MALIGYTTTTPPRRHFYDAPGLGPTNHTCNSVVEAGQALSHPWRPAISASALQGWSVRSGFLNQNASSTLRCIVAIRTLVEQLLRSTDLRRPESTSHSLRPAAVTNNRRPGTIEPPMLPTAQLKTLPGSNKHTNTIQIPPHGLSKMLKLFHT